MSKTRSAYCGKKFKSLLILCLVCFFAILISSFFIAGCRTETKTETETETEIEKGQAPITEMEKPRVEGLEEFHEVLHAVWHSYLPDGDYQSIRETMPEFKRTLKILMDAEVPDFYQHVKGEFEDKRQKLALAVENMDSVAQTGDDEKLKKAVEDMHAAFALTARVLAPRIKEIEEFHLVLYPLWHYAMPEKNYEAIKSAIPTLEDRMETLMAAQVPERLKDKKAQFTEKRQALGKAVEDLANVCRQNKDEEVIDKLTQMHERYRDLDEVFE